MSTLGDRFRNSTSSGVPSASISPVYLDADSFSVKGGSNSCNDSADCASGYTCSGGRCIRQDPTGASSGIGRITIPGTNNGCGIGPGDPQWNRISGSRGGCGGSGSITTPNDVGCDNPRAGQCETSERCFQSGDCYSYSSTSGGDGGGSGCGRNNGGGGGSMTVSLKKECDAFCDAWGAAFGDATKSPSCPPPCPYCEECSIFGTCKKLFGNCNCLKGGCGTCLERCKANGQCVSDSSFSCGNVGGPPDREADCKNSPEGCGGNGGQCNPSIAPVFKRCGNPTNIWGCVNSAVGVFCNCCGPVQGCPGRGTCPMYDGTIREVRCFDCSEFCRDTPSWCAGWSS